MKATKRKGWLAMDQNKLKQEAAQRAAEFVEDGMTIGLGTGSTVVYLVEAIAQRIKDEHFNLTGVATSVRTRHPGWPR